MISLELKFSSSPFNKMSHLIQRRHWCDTVLNVKDEFVPLLNKYRTLKMYPLLWIHMGEWKYTSMHS